MAHKHIDTDAIISWWDNGQIASTFTDEETMIAIARSLKINVEDVRAVLAASGRIEGD